MFQGFSLDRSFFNPLYKGHPDFRPTWISSEMAIRIAPSFHLKSPIIFKIILENKHVKTISIFKDVFYVNISFSLHRQAGNTTAIVCLPIAYNIHPDTALQIPWGSREPYVGRKRKLLGKKNLWKRWGRLYLSSKHFCVLDEKIASFPRRELICFPVVLHFYSGLKISF